MSSVREVRRPDQQKQTQPPSTQPPKPAARHHRVSFEVGPDDHPLLVVRKSMKAGDTRHVPSSLRTYGKSESMLMYDPEGKDRLQRIIDRVKNDDTLTHLLTPRGEDGITLSPPPTPPTPGRRHDIKWDQEAPMFFPLRLPAAPPPLVNSDDLITPSPKRKSSDDDVSFYPQTFPSINLRPRFECPWIIEKLGLPKMSDAMEECCDHQLPIPFAPFTSDDSEDEEDEEEGHVDKQRKPLSASKQVAPQSSNAKTTTNTGSPVASTSAKLAGLSLSVSAAAERSNIHRRKSMNARSA
mmetsp:Transcript_15844/g.26388  ORF Transcript_15844/g.26388 Transcript_15844/m.26388 type:complete len:296 (-) Transcript_15844:224-1111(-)